MMNDTFMKEKPVLPLILSMTLPMVLSMLVNSLYNIVDSFFVAQISEEAMTALSLVYPVQNFINAAGIGFGVGINAVIAFYLGVGDHRKADQAAIIRIADIPKERMASDAVNNPKSCAGKRMTANVPSTPMQPPRRHARFPAASTPAGEPCHFHCQKSHVPDVPIQFPAQGHGRRASCFRGRSFRPPQRYLRSHLPKPGSRQVRHNKGLCCSPSLLRLVLQSPAYIWGL